MMDYRTWSQTTGERSYRLYNQYLNTGKLDIQPQSDLSSRMGRQARRERERQKRRRRYLRKRYNYYGYYGRYEKTRPYYREGFYIYPEDRFIYNYRWFNRPPISYETYNQYGGTLRL